MSSLPNVPFDSEGLPGEEGNLPSVRSSVSGVSVGSDVQQESHVHSSKELVNLFIPNERLVELWTEIDQIEAHIATHGNMSVKLARLSLERLNWARNQLMSDRRNFADVQREVSEVKYLLTRSINIRLIQHPRVVFAYILVLSVLLIIGLLFTELMLGVFSAVYKNDLWNSILWGGLGGCTGALYSLVSHTSREQDYDPHFALWYYMSPLMGLLLGAFAYFILKVSVAALFINGGSVQISTYMFYLTAWFLGFQQDIVFAIFSAVLKRSVSTEKQIDYSEPDAPLEDAK
jgi:hypothetical protein